MKDYSRETLLKNIDYLIKTSGIKIGDLENKLEVSTGYISRLKSSDTYPNSEFLISLSNFFNVSIDSLIFSDFEHTTKDELYIYGFVDKLINDLQTKNVKWEKLKRSEFLDFEDASNLSKIYVEQKDDNGQWTRDVYSSMFVDEECSLNSDIYVLRTEWASIYLFSLSRNKTTDYELYIYSRELERLCRGSEEDNSYSFKKLSTLYLTAVEVDKHVSLSENTRSAIDKIINDE